MTIKSFFFEKLCRFQRYINLIHNLVVFNVVCFIDSAKIQKSFNVCKYAHSYFTLFYTKAND